MKLIIVTVVIWFVAGVMAVRALDTLDRQIEQEERI